MRDRLVVAIGLMGSLLRLAMILLRIADLLVVLMLGGVNGRLVLGIGGGGKRRALILRLLGRRPRLVLVVRNLMGKIGRRIGPAALNLVLFSARMSALNFAASRCTAWSSAAAQLANYRLMV
jgi:hypothetical protein